MPSTAQKPSKNRVNRCVSIAKLMGTVSVTSGLDQQDSAGGSFQRAQKRRQIGHLLGRQVAEQQLRHERLLLRNDDVHVSCSDFDQLVGGVLQDHLVRVLAHEQAAVYLAFFRLDQV